MQRDIKSIQDVYTISNNIVNIQNKLEKKIAKEESKDWDTQELKNMTINIKLIDRLFIAVDQRNNETEEFNDILLARQIINGVPIYFELSAVSNLDETLSHGYILYCKSPKVFIKNCGVTDCIKNRIYNFLNLHDDKKEHQCLVCKESLVFIDQ